MEKHESRFPEIEEYLASFSGELRTRLATICDIVETAVPSAEGRVSYKMPAYFLKGSLVYFAGFKKHIGFFPASAAVFNAFRQELAPYKQSGKGTVQFQHNQELPLDLIRRMVVFRVDENEQKKN